MAIVETMLSPEEIAEQQQFLAAHRCTNVERLKEAMVRTWNERYTDKQVEAFEDIVEPR